MFPKIWILTYVIHNTHILIVEVSGYTALSLHQGNKATNLWCLKRTHCMIGRRKKTWHCFVWTLVVLKFCGTYIRYINSQACLDAKTSLTRTAAGSFNKKRGIFDKLLSMEKFSLQLLREVILPSCYCELRKLFFSWFGIMSWDKTCQDASIASRQLRCNASKCVKNSSQLWSEQ